MENKQKIVVIDDEIRQCRSMKTVMGALFPKTEVEVFTNAAYALEYIEREAVQLIITDICMPHLDGISLVQKLMESDKSRKVILMTGYAEFEYARRAVSAGAFDFLLKPMDPEKLKSVMEKALNEIQEESLTHEAYDRMHQNLDVAWPVYVENLMNQWVSGSLSQGEKEKIQQIFPQEKKGFMILTKFWGIWHKEGDFGSQEIFARKNLLGLQMQNCLNPSCHSLSFFSHSLSETMVTLAFPRDGGKDFSPAIEYQAISRLFCKEIGKEYGIDGFVQTGVGILVENLESEKEKAYASAKEALEYAFYAPEGQICQSGKLERKPWNAVSLDLLQEEALADALQNREEEAALMQMDRILENCVNQGYPLPQELIQAMEDLLGHVARSLSYPSIFTFSASEGRCWSYAALKSSIRQYIQGFAQEMRQRAEEKGSVFATNFQDYIREHFMENISLEDVAGHFMLAPSYCSRLVKETTGSNFTQILVEERMKKARELLGNTQMRIYEIAGCVGYGDVKYFNRVFKKEIGMTPQQCRKEWGKARHGG